jgi:hypothetical protein
MTYGKWIDILKKKPKDVAPIEISTVKL